MPKDPQKPLLADVCPRMHAQKLVTHAGLLRLHANAFACMHAIMYVCVCVYMSVFCSMHIWFCIGLYCIPLHVSVHQCM
jgi:hypothetical protein